MPPATSRSTTKSSTTAGRDGAFRFAGIPDGRYRVMVCQFPKADGPLYIISGDFRGMVTTSLEGLGLSAIPPLPEAPTWVADVMVTVDGARDQEIVVPMQPGARISGRVGFEGSSPPPSAAELMKVPVAIRPADGSNFGIVMQPNVGAPQSRIEASGTFRSIGLPPGDYVAVPALTGVPEPPWTVWSASSMLVDGRETLGKAITLETTDITNVVITMTDQPTVIVGAVQDAKGLSSQDARVIIFPRDVGDRRHYWVDGRRILQVPVDRRGAFRVNVMPGDYLVASVTSFPPDWMTPEHLQTLAGAATSVRATAGQVATASVKIQSR